jgi:glycosyltransferase involved in cell wall biosynthesis
MNQALEVTVVIPTRDRWHLLARNALRTALGQEAVAHEVVVVDDGSRDETYARLTELDEPRLRVVRHERSLGVAGARNAGIATARGEWIAFLDDDDVWAPHKLRRQLDVAREAGAGFAYGGVVSVSEEGVVNYPFVLPDPDALLDELLERSSLPAGCSNVIVRADLVRRLGGFDEQFFQLADWDLWIRLAHESQAAACPDVLVGYLEHAENMLLTHQRDVTRELERIEAKHSALRRDRGVDLDGVTFLHWVAWGYLRRGRRVRAARVYLRCGLKHRRVHDVALAVGFALRSIAPIGWIRRLLRGRGGARGVEARVPADPPAWLAEFRWKGSDPSP